MKRTLLALSFVLALMVVAGAQQIINAPNVPAFVAPRGGGSTTFPLLIPDGTNAAPSLANSTATNTGLYFGAAGADLRYANAGTEVARFGNNYIWSATDGGSFVLGGGFDTAIGRAGAGEFSWTAVAFASLGTPSNGAFAYCSNCTIANPCASGGTGALAKRLNSVWVCN